MDAVFEGFSQLYNFVSVCVGQQETHPSISCAGAKPLKFFNIFKMLPGILINTLSPPKFTKQQFFSQGLTFKWSIQYRPFDIPYEFE